MTHSTMTQDDLDRFAGHTPGPWKACAFSSIVGCPVTAQPDKTKNTFNVCGVAAPVSREENIANARLIAAAPDLLAQIQSLTAENIALKARVEELRKALEHARGAIASLDDDDLGWSQPPHDEIEPWPLKAELLHTIDAALSTQGER